MCTQKFKIKPSELQFGKFYIDYLPSSHLFNRATIFTLNKIEGDFLYLNKIAKIYPHSEDIYATDSSNTYPFIISTLELFESYFYEIPKIVVDGVLYINTFSTFSEN